MRRGSPALDLEPFKQLKLTFDLNFSIESIFAGSDILLWNVQMLTEVLERNDLKADELSLFKAVIR